ncbi:MAG TPA: UTP--glucose-1-phosphate uridylyltransferase [Anaerolineae bacterium]|nr:UTP--glucose-1-phosphate uridylyltransferase [Anaerolineae bacterium]HQK14203.1 UTP--glucose-1-phosphate uridylyltransferase [Anaerolineae bacterium]
MHITKAVITAAGRNQRTLPLQTLIDRDGTEKSVLGILVEEALSAGVEEIAVVVAPGDEVPYAAVVGDHAGRLHFIPQNEPRGYGHAIYCAKDFVGDAPFLHLVGDHLYVSAEARSCAQQLVAVAEAENCAVSAVQATRESLLPYYGAIGGKRVAGRKDLYEIETVIEKPTPTEAELRLIVPGLRTGHYLCFFGMHVLTPTVMEILEWRMMNGESRISESANQPISPRPSAYGPQLVNQNSQRKTSITLSEALAVLATREKYLALEERALRYDVGVKYGLLIAQLALALAGNDREDILTRLVELLATRELRRSA